MQVHGNRQEEPNMKMIITGATGFVGRNLAETFQAKGLEVIATGRSMDVGAELVERGISFIPAHIEDPVQVEKVFSPADCVIHCAAKTADWGKYKEFYTTNVIGTRNIINACKAHHISKIMFISTPSVYFTGQDRFHIAESDPLPEKQFNYGKTKLIAEKDLLKLRSEGFQVIIFRPRAVYGPYDHTIVPRILKLSQKKHFPLINHGRALIDITYIGNLIAAVEDGLSAPHHAWNDIYNISNGDPIQFKEMIALVLNIFKRPFTPKNVSEFTAGSIAQIMECLSLLPFGNKTPAMTKFSVGYMAKSMTLSIAKAKRKLTYAPQIGNRQGFEIYEKWAQSLR
jgi:nucleoside-diphosphate-sugar epimerase